MTKGEAPVGAVVVLLFGAAVGSGAALFTSGFLTEHGTTSGSWVEGAVDGLELALVPLLAIGALAAAAFGLGRPSAWIRGGTIAVVLFSLGGVLTAGAQAAVAKYERLPQLPHCYDLDIAGSPAEPVARAVQDAFAGLEHPWRFSGAGSSGLDGCGTVLLDVSFEEAAAHYRGELPAKGWVVIRADASGLGARRSGLVFSLTRSGCGPVAIAIKPLEAASSPQAC